MYLAIGPGSILCQCKKCGFEMVQMSFNPAHLEKIVAETHYGDCQDCGAVDSMEVQTYVEFEPYD